MTGEDKRNVLAVLERMMEGTNGLVRATIMACKYAIWKMQEDDGWIPVEERFPDLIPCNAGTAYSEAVIVLTSGRKVMVAIWDGIDFCCAADYWDAEGEEITHWKPVPELPKEEEK